MKSKHSTAFDIITTFITKIIFLGGSFIISVILSNLLGAEGTGTVAALFVIPNTMVSLADLGVRQASAYYIGKGKYNVQEVLSTSLFLWIITSILSMLVVYVYFMLPNTTTYSLPLIAIGLAYVPVKILVSYFNGVLQGQQKITNMNMKFFIEFAVRLLFVLVLVWILNFDVVGAAFAQFVTNIAVIIYSGYIIRKTAKLKLRYIKGMPQDMFKKGIVFALALFVLTLNYRVDIVFLENMVDSNQVGVYSVGSTLAELIWQLPSAIGVVLFARSANSKSDNEASRRSATLLRLSWIPLIVGSILFFILAPTFVGLIYRPEFAEAGNVIRILLPGVVLMVLFKILNADLAGRGNPLFALKIYLVTLVINIGLNTVLIPEYGMYGAAFASTVSYMVGAVVFSIAYHRHTGLAYRDLFILNKNDKQMIKDSWLKAKQKIKM